MSLVLTKSMQVAGSEAGTLWLLMEDNRLVPVEVRGAKKELMKNLSLKKGEDLAGKVVAFCEKEKPEFAISRLNEFFSGMTDIVFQYGGTMDKFNGDGFMAFFGAPVYSDRHADNGVKASMAMLKKMDELNMRWSRSGNTLQLGIGLNSGPVIVGNIGSEQRMDYTVIGRVVDLASKLESLNKEYETDILIGEDTINMLGSNTPLEEISLKGLGYITNSPWVTR